MDDKVLNVAKSFLFTSLSIFFLVAAYLGFNSPSINFNLAEEIAKKEHALKSVGLKNVNARNNKLKEWTWFYSSDVAVNNEKYPIVILRSGYKVLRISEERSLVGWKIYIANTSPKSRYYPNIEYSITDSDGFEIGSSSAEGNFLSQSFGSIQGTMNIANADLERLSREDWTISIGSWITGESNTKGKRYDRLAKMIKDENSRPVWIDSVVKENQYITGFSDKWKLIKSIVYPETPKNLDELEGSFVEGSKSSGLSPEEKKELAELEKEFGQVK